MVPSTTTIHEFPVNWLYECKPVKTLIIISHNLPALSIKILPFSSSEILGFDNEVEYVDSEDPSILSSTSGGVADKDLSYCTVKTGVNDLLDYISLAVALIIPLVLGPLVVGVLQVRTNKQN